MTTFIMKRGRTILAAVSLLITGGIASATELSDAAAQAQPGTFVQMNVPGFDDSLLYWNGRHAFQYTDELKWDPVRREVLFTGAGHLVQTRHLVYSESANQWTSSVPPTNITTTHGYDHAAIDVANRKYYFRAFNERHFEILDLDTGSWSRGNRFGDVMQVAGGIAWFPELGRVIFVDDYQGILSWNPENGNWSTLQANVSTGPYHNYAEYSPVHRVVIAGGGNDSRSVYRVNSNGSVTRMGDAPVDLGITATTITVDPVTGNFIVITIGGTAYEYEPISDTWTRLSISLPQMFTNRNGANGEWGLVATPIDTYGVILFAKYEGNNSKMFVYRHSASSGTPPPPLPNPPPSVQLSASPGSVTSGGSVTLNWSVANADNCAAGGAWSGNKNANGGQEVISGLTTDSTFTLDCSGPGGSEMDSVTVTITGGGGGGSDADADWNARSTAPGVLMATRFDTQAEVDAGKAGSMQGNVVWDNSIRTSGGGSLRFNLLNTDTTSSGNWRRYLADDQRQFQPGDEFYVQYRQYIPAYVIEHQWRGGQFSGNYAQGFKSSIISHFPNSNTDFEIVIQNTGQRGYIQGYWQDGRSSAVPWDRSISTACNGSDFVHQPAIDNGPQNVGTPCENDRARYGGLYSYQANLGGGRGEPDPLTGAFVYEKDQWITILQHVRISSSGYNATDNLVETWAARDGEDYILLMSDNNVQFGNSGRFDALWLTPYRSQGQSDPNRQNTFTAYDEVIVSTEFIPAPGNSDMVRRQGSAITDLVAE